MARGASSAWVWVVLLLNPDRTFRKQVYAGNELETRRVFTRIRDRWARASVDPEFVGCMLVLYRPSGREVEAWQVRESSGAA